jgi:hypothetical protein
MRIALVAALMLTTATALPFNAAAQTTAEAPVRQVTAAELPKRFGKPGDKYMSIMGVEVR